VDSFGRNVDLIICLSSASDKLDISSSGGLFWVLLDDGAAEAEQPW